ncbi:helix-turn-helix domain-containing protein [Blastococcus sp. CT_GayMR16]|uniref:winged helix-turn-helix transcriptional regulator n=1 Tax=Blastococcus sp. CT_GayMR16 TaxID=2559607 RepID=UPI001073E50C|nr:helix-turn-helix domain-containing protein [Blastococcus sp. CT_GayMR16]TFV85999.1 transcriptional regulator [Blastococcus sp. CT_GayMR16]
MTEDPAHSARACDGALVRVFDVLGKRWNGVIIGVLVDGPASFSELRRAVHGISDSVLSDRLTELAATGLVHRTVAEGPPVSVRYELTDSGTKLMPALRELSRWAADNLDATAPTA